MTSQYFLDRISGRDRSIRAADADRERVAERLRTSHGEGRLDVEELQQRLDGCYDAKTLGQLRDLVSDLPRVEARERRRSLAWFGLSRRSVVVLAAVLVALIAVSAAAGHHGGHHAFWLWVPIVFVFWRFGSWRRRRAWTGARQGWDRPA
jgi:hypothetical protein